MKKACMFFALTLIAVVAFGGSSPACAFPGGAWVSSVNVFNLSSSTATITIDFYYTTGEKAFSVVDILGGNKSKSWYLPGVGSLPVGFIGSAVVYADQTITSSVNTQIYGDAIGTITDPNRVGASSGVYAASTTLYATQILKTYSDPWNEWNSYCVVQNLWPAQSTVTATYYDASGAAIVVRQVSLAPYGGQVFDQHLDPGLPDHFVGSATFQGNLITGICNFYNSAADYTRAQFHSYNGISNGAATLYVPRLVKNYYGYTSGLRIQNIGAAATTVTVDYYASIGPGQAWGPYLGSLPLPDGFNGSAIVRAGPGSVIAAIYNEDNRTLGRGVTLNAAPEGTGTGVVTFPQIVSKFYGYCSGWQVQNVGGGTASCTAYYSAMDGQPAIPPYPFTVGANKSFQQYAPNAPGMPADYNGSVRVECNQPIVGIANMSFRSDTDPRWGENYGDSFSAYHGTNQ